MITEQDPTLETSPADAPVTGAQPDGGSPDAGSPSTDQGTAAAENPAPEDTSSSATDSRNESPSEVLGKLREQREQAKPKTDVSAPAAQPDLSAQYAEAQKRLEHLQALQGRQAQELGELRRFRQEREQREQAELEQQRQAALAAQIPPFSKRHPEFHQTQARVNRVRDYERAVRALPADMPDETKRSVAESMAQNMGLTQEDAKLYRQAEAHRESMQERVATDFEGLFDELFEQRFLSKMKEREQFEASRWRTNQILNDEKLKPIIDSHQDAILWAMEHPKRHEVGLRLAQLEAENAELRKRTLDQTAQVASAKTGRQELRQRAIVRRDPSTATHEDVLGEAERRGLEGPDLIRFLRERRSQE